MFKLLEYIVVSIGILFVVFSIGLAYLNWNESLKEKLLSGILVGAVTIFALIYANLKEGAFQKSFRISIAVDNRNYLPPLASPLGGLERLTTRQNQFSVLSAPKLKVDGKERILFSVPTNTNEETGFYLEMMQYVILKSILENQRQRTTLAHVGPSGAVMENGVYRPYRATKSMEIDTSDFSSRFSTNRFFARPEPTFMSRYGKFRLPSNPMIDLSYEPGSPDHGPESRVVALVDERHFFEISFSVIPLGTVHSTSPAGLNFPETQRVHLDTHTFLVKVEAKFNRYRSLHWEMQEYETWIERTYENISKQLGDAG